MASCFINFVYDFPSWRRCGQWPALVPIYFHLYLYSDSLPIFSFNLLLLRPHPFWHCSILFLFPFAFLFFSFFFYLQSHSLQLQISYIFKCARSWWWMNNNIIGAERFPWDKYKMIFLLFSINERLRLRMGGWITISGITIKVSISPKLWYSRENHNTFTIIIIVFRFTVWPLIQVKEGTKIMSILMDCGSLSLMRYNVHRKLNLSEWVYFSRYKNIIIKIFLQSVVSVRSKIHVSSGALNSFRWDSHPKILDR